MIRLVLVSAGCVVAEVFSPVVPSVPFVAGGRPSLTVALADGVERSYYVVGVGEYRYVQDGVGGPISLAECLVLVEETLDPRFANVAR